MQYVVTEDAVHMKADAVTLQWLQDPSIALECGCRGHAVDAVSHKVDAVCFVRGCSSHESGCRELSLVAVPPTVSLNVDAVPMQCMQCSTWWMRYAGMEDAVPMKVDAVNLQWLQCPLQFP